jgi:hypothetical protein
VTPDRAPQKDRHWGLFADWCAAVDRSALPATPDTVVTFLAELPAGPATTLRRVHAIDNAHHTAALTPPGGDPVFDGLLRPARPPRFEPGLVAAALQAIPVGGWPAGIVGRRDAALIALICTAGMTRRQAQALRCGPRPGNPRETTTSENPATTETVIRGNAVPAMATSPHPGTCPACALTRWLRVAAMTETVGWRAVRNELADLGENPAGTETVHDCTRPPTWNPPAGWRSFPDRRLPLFPAIDRHGAPQPTFPLSTRSITTIITARLTAPTPEPDGWGSPNAATGVIGRSWDDADHIRLRTERKKAMNRLASYETILDQADAYADAVLQRLDAGLHDADTT